MEDIGPQNAVVGDVMEIPVTEVPEPQLNEEKLLAKFSKTKEYLRLKEYMEARIQFFQKFLPNGDPISAEHVVNQDTINNWIIANTVIGEFRAVLNSYENANEVVTAAEKAKHVA